jgi:hypothetical protein
MIGARYVQLPLPTLLSGFVRLLETWKTLDFYFSPDKPLKTLEFQISWKALENWETELGIGLYLNYF